MINSFFFASLAFFQTEFCYVAQADLNLQESSCLSFSSSGITDTDVNHHTYLW